MLNYSLLKWSSLATFLTAVFEMHMVGWQLRLAARPHHLNSSASSRVPSLLSVVTPNSHHHQISLARLGKITPHKSAKMMRTDSSRIESKRSALDYRKKQFSAPEWKDQTYPHRLNFYSTPPTADITLEQFEQWAVDRLKGVFSPSLPISPDLEMVRSENNR